MKKIFLYPNFTKEGTQDAAEQIVRRLVELDMEVWCDRETMEKLPSSAGASCQFRDYRQCLAECQAALVIGGDGSILRLAPDAARHDLPILGVNTGKLGFMSELDAHELHHLKDLAQGRYTIDTRMMLDVSVCRQGEQVYAASLLNDVVITKWTQARLIGVAVSVDGVLTASIQGDGIIVATPTGSTAYTLSAGGPIIEPNANCMAVTPICAHELGAKPFVLSAERTVAIAAGAEDNQAFLSADGGAPFAIDPADIVAVRRSQWQTRLIRLKNIGFYQLIHKKLSI